jgi:hypothetical protein
MATTVQDREGARMVQDNFLKYTVQIPEDHVHYGGDLDFSWYCEGSVIISCDTTNLCYTWLSKLQILLIDCVKKLQPKLVVIAEEELLYLTPPLWSSSLRGCTTSLWCLSP